jgi:hypothetical protein
VSTAVAEGNVSWSWWAARAAVIRSFDLSFLSVDAVGVDREQYGHVVTEPPGYLSGGDAAVERTVRPRRDVGRTIGARVASDVPCQNSMQVFDQVFFWAG